MHPPWLRVVAIVVGIAALVSLHWRRTHPAAVGIGVGVVSLVILTASGANLAATFNAAIRARGRDLAVIVGLLIAWAFASPLLYPRAGSYWVNAGTCLLLTGVVLGWGLFVRARRELVRSLRAQADRAADEARAAERRRIAREMHDQFGEQLTALTLRIRMLKEAVGENAGLRTHVESLRKIAERLDRDVDHLVWELRPTALDDLGLRAALANYVQNWSDRVGIAAVVHTSGLLDYRLTPDAETALYRIAQEALTNVAKHARAKNVEVILERRADHVLLAIEDDGVGFDPAAREDRGQAFGLLGMQERAALVGATLEIESSSGQGTTVLVRLAAVTAATPVRDYV
jgi:signal transduction histidine kinase